MSKLSLIRVISSAIGSLVAVLCYQAITRDSISSGALKCVRSHQEWYLMHIGKALHPMPRTVCDERGPKQ